MSEEDLKRLEKRCPLRCDFSQAIKDLKREPSITAREMYQRGYAAAERDLKREPLSEGELNSLYYQATNQTLREQDTRLAFGFARAIEREHGIGIVE